MLSPWILNDSFERKIDVQPMTFQGGFRVKLAEFYDYPDFTVGDKTLPGRNGDIHATVKNFTVEIDQKMTLIKLI